jgi:gliding motility-associated lipoprotein GldH
MQGRWLIAAMAAMALLTGCHRQRPAYGHFVHTPTAGWTATDTLCYCVTLPAGTLPDKQRSDYRLELCLRSDSRYTRTGLTLQVVQQLDTVSRRRVAFPMSDKRGRSYGSGIAVRQQQRQLAIVSMSPEDTLRLRITPDIEPDNTLHGITDVGLLLTRR